MHIIEIFQQQSPVISFEFFPPKTSDSFDSLFRSISKLTPLGPSYVSVTYGAGGSSRNLTNELVLKLKKETNLAIVSHLTCVGSTEKEINSILTEYEKSGIKNILALRGDRPKDLSFEKTSKQEFTYAGDLVKYVKKNFPKFGIGVAGFPEGHPETPNRLKEMDFLKKKVDAGADYICTQLFFDNNAFYDFCERCEIMGIRIPIIAGIMPITSMQGLQRMAELAQGANIPAKLLKALKRVDNDAGFEKVGTHWATEQVRDLLDNKVKGIHFYTLNKSKATLKIYESLGVQNSRAFLQ